MAGSTPTVSLSLQALLDPRSIAVVGASADPAKAGGRPLHYMLESGYRGRLYPVNPKRAEVMGLQCYASIAELPEAVDLCVLAVPADSVEGYIEECGARGVKAAVVFASGYAETGEEGRERQDRLCALAVRHGIALCGPNCLGLVNVGSGAAPTFTTALERRASVEAGSIGFVSQSGAVGAFVLGMAQDDGVGLSHFITTGNEAVLGLTEYVQWLLDDPGTSVIAGYLEGAEGADLVRVAAAALEARKPLVLMKVGASAAGAAASIAHTGKLAGVDAVYEAAFARYGITRAHTLEELLDFSRALAHAKRPAGDGVGIVSTSGGAAILMSDWCERVGLQVPALATETAARLGETLPWFAAGRNPVDTTGRPLWEDAMLRDTLSAVAADPSVSLVVCHVGLAPGPGRRIAAEVVEAARGSEKPFFVCWLSELDPEPHAALRQEGIPVFRDPVRMVRAAGTLVRYAGTTLAPQPTGVAQPVTEPPAGAVVTEHRAKSWLAANGLRSTREEVAADAAAAVAAAERIGYPVCLKLLSPDIPHRSDVGCVKIGLCDAAEVAEGYEQVVAAARRAVPDAVVEGVLVQELAGRGQELIVSGFRDPVFGPCVLCGTGGVLAEVLVDTAIRLAPVDGAEAAEMLAALRGAALLRGPRGSEPFDEPAAAAVIARVSQLIAGVPDDVDAIEINPLLVQQDGALVLDALVTRRQEAQ